MRRVFSASVVSLVLLLAATGCGAQPDPEAGEKKAQVCASCHGPEGRNPTGPFPVLAGQYKDYLVHALKAYRSGERQDPVMQNFAGNLSDQDILDIAAYFAQIEGLEVKAYTRD